MKDKKFSSVFENEAKIHLNEIYRAALRMTRKPEDAEELVQETFMQAWKSIENYEPGTNCRAWLYRILFNKHSQHIRKFSAQRKYIREADDFELLNATRPPIIPEHITDEVIIESLNRLPEHYRSVVLLVDVHEFKYKEVSEILVIAVGTVMSRLHRARRILRETLEGVAHEQGITKNIL